MESGEVLGITNTYLHLLILVGSILVVALFSSSEAALLAANRVRIRHLAEEGQGSAQAVEQVVNKHEKFFAAILLTENAFLIFASAVGTVMTINLAEQVDIGGVPPELIATFVLTIVIVQFGQIIPKTLAARGANGWSLIVARPIQFVMWAETVVLYLFTLVPKLIYRLAGGDPGRMGPSVTEGELRMLIGVASTEGAVQRAEAEMLEKVFHFNDRPLSEAMTPRSEIVWVQRGATLQEFLALYALHAHTRFPVFEDNHENVVGFLSVKDVLRAVAQGKLQPNDRVTGQLRPAHFTPQAKPVGELFDELREGGHQMAIVIDQHGGVAGLVTLKQLMEVIVGAFGEEGQPPEAAFVATGLERYRLSAAMSIQEANARLRLGLPEGDYKTLAGFILKRMGRIPEVGDQATYSDLRFEVRAMRRLRIHQVEVQRVPQPAESAEAPQP